jgi:predicted component of type VI protein secretion system
MVQLKILSGKKAGTVMVARRFPVRIGRNANAALQLDDPGVWDQHVEIGFQPNEGFVLTTQDGALTSVNAQSAQRAVLRNGDEIEIGSVKFQFSLPAVRQRGLRFREWIVWGMIAAVSIAQIAVVYWLLQ